MGALAYFLALVLLVAAAHKAVARERMAVATARLLGLNHAMGATFAWTAAGIEALAALALILPDTRALGAIIAALLWAGYGVALVRHWGQTLDCGCSFSSRENPVGLFAVARATALALLGVMVAIFPSATFTPEAPFAALGFFALLTATGELADNLPGLRRLTT
jgi:hypothetical protein